MHDHIQQHEIRRIYPIALSNGVYVKQGIVFINTRNVHLLLIRSIPWVDRQEFIA